MKNFSIIVPTSRAVLAALVLFVFAPAAQAVLIANWSFESFGPDVFNTTDYGPLASDFGTGIARGHHTSAGTDWTSPVGNGSANSWSSNNWGIGDYYLFQISTLALSNVTIEWDQTRSPLGPADFVLQWSNDGTTFTDFANYTVLEAGASLSQPDWSSITGFPIYHFSYDLSSVTALDNHAAIYLRLTSQVAGTNFNGTNRVDNVNIAVLDEPIVPEPSTWALGCAAAAGLWLVQRRRRA